MALEITDTSFDEVVLKSNKLVIIHFYATEHNRSNITRSIIEEISDEYEGKIIVGSVHINKNEKQTAKYSIRNTPTFLMFKNEKLCVRSVGVVPKKTYREDIEALLY